MGKKDAGQYFEKAMEIIQEYEFIVLKSFAIYVNKAVLVAGLLAREYPQVKQINIPSTVRVIVHQKRRSKTQYRGAIRI